MNPRTTVDRRARLPRRAWMRGAVASLAALALATPSPARAQSAGDGFLFAPPAGTLTLRAGFAAADARSDLFDFLTETHTLRHRDFGGVTLGAELAVGRPGSRFAVLAGIGYASATAPSEFRDLEGEDDLPIAQTTTFRRVPMHVGVRAYLLPPGRSVGTLAWVPARVAPYVGAGGGAMWYRFGQQGEFVDFETNDIFEDEFTSSGVGPMGFATAGVDVTLGPRTALTVDARYTRARAVTGGDYKGFDRIDLSGLATTVGLTFRF